MPITDPASLQDLDIDRPTATGHDLLIRVDAVSVNPVDTKVRMRKASEDGPPVILGWDAVGEVVETGEAATETLGTISAETLRRPPRYSGQSTVSG